MNEEGERTIHARVEGERHLEVLHLPEVRVSTASLVIIRDSQGRYALLVNQNRAKKGEIVLTPVGGAIEATPEGLESLKQLLGLDEASFESGADLRFTMSGSQANRYREWFLVGEQRESNPLREIQEELVDESGLLSEDDLSELEWRKKGYATELAQTTRKGQEGKQTLRLIEVFEVEINGETRQKLQDHAQLPKSLIRFVSENEIRNGKTIDGLEIGSISKFLLNTEESIKEFE
ncbi:MAG: hypothetical protein NUV84_01525 [Candidatus Uhrbacteria bacterium]|nr:hypothetical protein [Candidatus Uhrbacteria bacterium]